MHQNNTVEKHFGDEHLGCRCGHFAGVVDSVTTYREARSILFRFFRTYRTDKLAVCDIFSSVVRDFVFANEFYRVSRVFDSTSDSVGETTEFVGRGKAPRFLVRGVPHELPIIEHFA